MQGNKIIDYSDKSLFEDSQYIPSPDEKDFYTPEEAYELVMSDVRSVYFMKTTFFPFRKPFGKKMSSCP